MELIADIVPVLLLATFLGFLLSRIGQVPLLGYLIAGMVARALSPESGTHADVVAFLGELGIVLLLFYLGLELSWREVMPIAGRSLALAIAATGIPFLLLHGILLLMGMSSFTSLLLAFALALTSTAIGAQVAELRGEMNGRLGRFVIGVNLILDVLAVVVIAVLAAGRGESASVGTLLLRIAAFAVVVGSAGLLVVPRVLDIVHQHTASRIILPVLLISFGVGVALMGSRFGVPLSMGAFLAGSLASEAKCREALEGYLHPVKELFIAFFFIGVGFRVTPDAMLALVPVALVISIALLLVRSAAVSISAYILGEEPRLSIALAAALLPVGEFSFLVLSEAGLAPGVQQQLLAIACLGMFFTAFLVEPLLRLSPKLEDLVGRKTPSALRTLLAIIRGALAPSLSPFPPAGNPTRAAFRDFAFSAVAVVALSVGISEGASWLDSITPRWMDFRLAGVAIAMGLLAPVIWIAWSRWRHFLVTLLGPLKTGPGTERIRLVQLTTRGALNTVGIALTITTMIPVFYSLFGERRFPVILGVLAIGTLLAILFRKDVARLHDLLELGMSRNVGRGAGMEKRGRTASTGTAVRPAAEAPAGAVNTAASDTPGDKPL